MRAVILVLAAMPAWADTVVPTRTIRPEETLTAADIAVVSAVTLGSYAQADAVIGQEARVVLYPGRAIRLGDLREPALVSRNALVEIVYRRNGLQITAEGRALARGSAGEVIAVLNTSSHARVNGRITPDGRVLVE
ncbi:MAG: flagellar basal body P-ring formation protein FlgA [Roseivivax sp.]|nr:flagellar basal body P-ring formation protein FlgA [Roseivivax sp.]